MMCLPKEGKLSPGTIERRKCGNKKEGGGGSLPRASRSRMKEILLFVVAAVDSAATSAVAGALFLVFNGADIISFAVSCCMFLFFFRSLLRANMLGK